MRVILVGFGRGIGEKWVGWGRERGWVWWRIRVVGDRNVGLDG